MEFGGRLAGGPISWGVCEVPGWGLMLPPERVLGEMVALGLHATELGPTGYLGNDAAAVRALLDRFGLRLVGGFVPVVLHDLAARAQTERIARSAAELLSAAGADAFVTAVVVDQEWSPRVPLDAAGWGNIFDGLDLLDEICAAHGLTQALHPHVGTLVETADDVERVLNRSGVRWCLDTGHLSLGGVDPVAFAAANVGRVAHVHLKDVRLDLAPALRRGELTLLEATRSGMFCPLGEGNVAVGDVIAHLERAGYNGWYVLEQDAALSSDALLAGSGPQDGVRRSLAFLDALTRLATGVLPADHRTT